MSAPDPTSRPKLGETLPKAELSNAALIRRLLALAWPYRRSCMKMVGYQTLLTLLQVSGLGLTGLAIQVVAYKIDPMKNKPPHWPLGIAVPEGWHGRTLGLVSGVAGAIIVFALVRAALTYLATVSQGRLIQDIVVTLRAQVYGKLQRLSFRFYDANESGSIINRVTGDVQAVRMFVDGVIIQLVNLLVTLGVYLVYMLSIDAGLTFWCLASTPLLLWSAVVFSNRVRPAHRKNRELEDTMIRTLSENLQGVTVVKGFAREKEEIEKFGKANAAVRNQQGWIFWQNSIFTPLMGFLTQANLIVLLGYGGWLVIHRRIGIGDGLIVFAMLLLQFSNQVAQIAQLSNSLQRSLTGAQRVFEVLDAPVEIMNPAEPVPLKKAKGAVRFEHVTFGYRSDDPVLLDVSFDVKAGQCVAVVGATGSGKSTVMSLIPRFYDPQVGKVVVDGIDVRKYRVDELRRNVGVVFQESFLFSNTVAANIAFGHPEASLEQIEKAAKIAAAHEFIVGLKDGYDTYIGERGADLSGGQRQRLAIARAVLLEPAILLMDDPTAAIDPQTEHEIMAAMESAMSGRTTFVVAHRLSTLRRADLVIVLENGRVVQTGTHDQLMAEKGHYHKAAALQIADVESLAALGIAEEHA